MSKRAQKAYCSKCGHEFEGEFVTTPSDDGRYTYTWGPICPKCGGEGRSWKLDASPHLKYIAPEDVSK